MSCCKKNNVRKKLPGPTAAQLEWADREMGVLIHFDIPVYRPDFYFRDHWGEHLDASIFNPVQLDTDQWIKTAYEAGAKYAVLVAKHCTGFCLWPTEAHEYSVKNSPWKDGNGDIVGDFVKSCRKYGVKPGLYYSIACNGYYNVDNPGKVLSGNDDEQKQYNEMVIKQVTELWTKYGELFEIWFDGGALPPEQGGPDILPLLLRYQPQAVCFQGPEDFPSILRWVGNEDGIAPNPCWSTTNLSTGSFDGTMQFAEVGVGDPDGCVWAPAETDMPNRKVEAYGGGWFWKEGEDHLLYTVDELVDRYYTSVGSNTNLLIGMVIDERGLVPDADVLQFSEFGREIKRRFEKPLGETQGEGSSLTLEFDSPVKVNNIVLMEDISSGEHVREYRIDGMVDGEWKTLVNGLSIGHKRISRIEAVEVTSLQFIALNAVAEPKIRKFAAFCV